MPALEEMPAEGLHPVRDLPTAHGDAGKAIDLSLSQAFESLIQPNLSAREILNIAPLLSEIDDLMREPEHDSNGPLRPTAYANATMKDLLRDAQQDAVRRRFTFPEGGVGTDSNGGIRIEWSAPGRVVYFVVRRDAAKGNYVYYEAAGRCCIEHNITGPQLVGCLEGFVFAR